MCVYIYIYIYAENKSLYLENHLAKKLLRGK